MNLSDHQDGTAKVPVATGNPLPFQQVTITLIDFLQSHLGILIIPIST